MFLSHTAPCSVHWGLSLTVNQWSCAILNFDLWGCFCFESQERGGGGWRERTGNTTLIRRTQDELESLNVWSRLHVIRGLVLHTYTKNKVYSSLPGMQILQRQRITQILMPTHCRETWRGGMREEEIKRKLAQASVSTAVSAKAWGEGEAGGRRRLRHCRERRGEKKGREDKRKLRVQCQASQARK